ncbi:hypothetical protein BJ170DRAFT_685338 [Xylariales sp. AK1849]|nr:hypothetical protein BJ170DRAFT_685338 [Xylariales sp. AK1849]
MRSISVTLAVFLAGIASVHASREEQSISDTTCYDKKSQTDMIASTDDCEGAIDKVYKLSQSGGGIGGPVSSGCKEVATSGSCSLSICNMNTGATTVSYGAIASAGQWIHGICKGNPSTHTTGGYSSVQGFQQAGEAHSLGRVLLAKKVSKKRGTPNGDDIVDRNADDTVVARTDDDSQTNVPGTNHVLVRNWVSNVESGLEDLNRQDQGKSWPPMWRLVDRFVTAWNAQQGSSTIVTSRINVGTVQYTLSFVAHNNADITRVAAGNRRNEVESFFRLRTRNGSPSTFSARLQVDDGTVLGTMMLMDVDMTPSVGNFFGVALHVEGSF